MGISGSLHQAVRVATRVVTGLHQPLRERQEDIPPLAEYFLRENDKDIDGFGPGVYEMLQSYHWPGNVRELRNAIHRACVLAEAGSPIQAKVIFYFTIEQKGSIL